MLAQFACCLAGIWMMVAPAVVGYGDPAQFANRLLGPIMASLGCVAMFECCRSVRRANTVLGAWLLVEPLVLGYSAGPLLNNMAIGVLVIACSLVRGRIDGRYGGGWSALWKKSAAGQLQPPE